MDLDDPTLRDRLIAARVARDEAAEAVRQFVDRPVGGPAVITPARVQRLAAVLRDCLRTGDMGLRKSYLRMFLDQVVVVAAEIRLRGPTAALAAAANSGELSPAGMVPSFVRKWRPVGPPNASEIIDYFAIFRRHPTICPTFPARMVAHAPGRPSRDAPSRGLGTRPCLRVQVPVAPLDALQQKGNQEAKAPFGRQEFLAGVDA